MSSLLDVFDYATILDIFCEEVCECEPCGDLWNCDACSDGNLDGCPEMIFCERHWEELA